MIQTYFYRLQRFSGVLAVLVLWISTLISMDRTGLGLFDDRPISYLSTAPASRLLFSGSLIMSALLLILFAEYIRREFAVTNKFFKYFVVGQVCQIILALSPYGERTVSGVIHLIAAFTLAFSLPLLIKQFTISQHDKKYHNVYQYLLRFEQISFVIGMSLFIFTRGLAPLGEAMPAIGFHLWIIVVTYVATTRPDHLS